MPCTRQCRTSTTWTDRTAVSPRFSCPLHLQRFLSKWTGKGVYAAVFDNVEDQLSLARLQCFDFQGVNNKQYADLIEPLMVWLLRRIEDVLYAKENLGVPKHIVIEELFSSMKNKQLLDAALASIKTVRKNLGGVTLIGQSAMDLGDNADSIVNSCTSFLCSCRTPPSTGSTTESCSACPTSRSNSSRACSRARRSTSGATASPRSFASTWTRAAMRLSPRSQRTGCAAPS